ncbi:NAD kinase [Citricoccus sp. SGAir0253]|uniref:NAD kinase n=1 Tax=Citricoccus sp. SGAir0253 TaxID=2567881 RepID=UPI0010CCE3F5|nr:NAD kinase [Citricoccus sp. SGAir0253]QCU77789.1 NAD kinase [Citricoccus sp. SGAir0253]
MARRILVLAHTGREDAIRAAIHTCAKLQEAGLVPVLLSADAHAIREAIGTGVVPALDSAPETLDLDCTLADIALGVVLGGDGSVLRAAELVREGGVPLLAVNLGHVGFLAESERTDLGRTVEAVVAEDYSVEERMAIDVRVYDDDTLVARTWALNEASVEKSNRERMLEVITAVDGRPISTYGCDGIVMATPTGSTAYAFSAGGPVVWPEVQAMLMVPISAHALFVRPLVVSPDSVLTVEVLPRTNEPGVLWCDGRRTVDLPLGARIEVTRSAQPVRIARLSRTPFSERLVRKFNLPTKGWRGPVTEQDRAEVAAREARYAALQAERGSSDSPGVSVVEPHHLAPRPGVVPPATAAVPVVVRKDERLPLARSSATPAEPDPWHAPGPADGAGA